jgi:nitrate reductase delta subunit
MRTLKILGFLLCYPQPHHIQAAAECKAILKDEGWLSAAALEALSPLFDGFRTKSLLDLQEDYVALFDRTPSLSLHLFEHIHGDSRERGSALVDLMKVYEDAGLFLKENETPDYLPLFAEYVSTLPPGEAAETLGSIVDILSSLAQRLGNRESAYGPVLEAMVEAARRAPDAKAVKAYMEKSSGAPLGFDETDKEWEEQFAFDNTTLAAGQDSGCPKAEQMLARIAGHKEEKGHGHG